MKEPPPLHHVELLARTEALENQCRSLRRTNRACLVAAGVAIAIAIIPWTARRPSGPGTIEATEFRLLGAGDKIAAKLWMYPSGGPELLLQDGEGQARLTLGVNKDGRPVLGLFDPGEKTRATLLIDRDGTVVSSLFDAAGKAVAADRITRDGALSSMYYATDGKVRVGIEVSTGGDAAFTIQHRNGNPRIRTAVEPDGSVGQTFIGTRGIARITNQVLPDDAVGLVIGHPERERFFVLVNKRDQVTTGVTDEKDHITRFYPAADSR